MNKSILKVLSVLFAFQLCILSFITVNAVSTYVDGYYSFAETSDVDFVAMYGFSDNVSVPVDVVFPDSSYGKYVRYLNEFAFYESDLVKSIDFTNAKHLTNIDSKAFAKSSVAGEIKLPASLRSIGVGAFQECESLTSVVIGNKLSEISEQCFYGCSSLTSVKLSQNTVSIGKLAFADCQSLDSVYIPSSVNEINSNAFNGSSSVVFYCEYGSYAHEYAVSHNIPYEFIDYIMGDANNDRLINIQDVTLIQKYKAGLKQLTGNGLKAADVTGDGEVSVRDATQIQRYLANIITDF